MLPAWAQATEQPAAIALRASGSARWRSARRGRRSGQGGRREGPRRSVRPEHDLFSKAYELNKSPSLEKLVKWSKDFNAQREHFVTERRKEYEKAVSEVKLLQEKSKPIYAMEIAARAFLLADDKETFRTEPWVDTLLTKAKTLADQYEHEEQWLHAMRLYSDLSGDRAGQPGVEGKAQDSDPSHPPAGALHAGRAPEDSESGAKERDEVDALLNSRHETDDQARQQGRGRGGRAAQPHRLARRPARTSARSMLDDALINARQNYYRDVDYKGPASAGSRACAVLATTQGLETDFPGLRRRGEPRRVPRARSTQASPNAEAPRQAMTAQRRARTSLDEAQRAVNDDSVNLPEEVLVSEFADGAFAELDPFTSMIWPSDLEEFNKTTQGEFSGVGIQIQSDEDGSLKVVSPLEDSPAYKAGIKAGDIITHINGKNAKGITSTRRSRPSPAAAARRSR